MSVENIFACRKWGLDNSHQVSNVALEKLGLSSASSFLATSVIPISKDERTMAAIRTVPYTRRNQGKAQYGTSETETLKKKTPEPYRSCVTVPIVRG